MRTWAYFVLGVAVLVTLLAGLIELAVIYG